MNLIPLDQDKVFNPGILIHENLFEVTIRVTPDKNVKNISISNASLILENFNPPLYELHFHKKVPGSETLLSSSSENEEKVFNPGIVTSKGVHTSLLLELSHRGPKAFKVIKVFESPMEIFPCSYGEDICILDVPLAMAYSASSGSSKKVVPKYVKFMVLEKISECKRTINFIVGEVQNATSHLEHLNGMIEMLEGMHFTLEIYDSVWCLREMVKSENKKLNDLNKQLLDAEEDIRDFVDENMTDDMPVLDEVVFKIHKNGYFELDPLRYVNGSVSSVSAFTCDRDIFPACLNWILSSILENKWALFYCLPNKSLEKGLKLIHTDNDVHSFFADAERRGKIHLYVTHKQQALGKFYLKNMVWLEEDASLRCSSSSPFSTRIKRKSHKTTKECGRKNSRGKEKMVDDEPLGRKLLKTSRKGKEKMDEFPDSTPIKERKYCDDRVGRMSMQTFMNELGEFPDLTPTKEREVDDEAVGRNSIRTRRKGKEIMAEFSDASDEEVKCKVKSHEKRKLDASATSPQELVEWAEQEAGSPKLVHLT
ncbi:hypothetical protein Tco_0357085 [Tanacetum coccineum]